MFDSTSLKFDSTAWTFDEAGQLLVVGPATTVVSTNPLVLRFGVLRLTPIESTSVFSSVILTLQRQLRLVLTPIFVSVHTIGMRQERHLSLGPISISAFLTSLNFRQPPTVERLTSVLPAQISLEGSIPPDEDLISQIPASHTLEAHLP